MGGMRTPRHEPVMDDFYAALPTPPEGLEQECIAIGISNYWIWFDRWLEGHMDPEKDRDLQVVVGRLMFALGLLGDERIAELAAMPYAEYLASREWNARRTRVKERAEGRCQLCNKRGNLHVHHRTYDDRGYERWGDLIALCADCHEAFHETRELA